MADSVSRKLIKTEAKRRNWQISYIGQNEYFCKLTDENGRTEIFRGSRPLKNSANGLVICKDKDLTLQYVQSLGYKVPDYLVLEGFDNKTLSDFLELYKTVVVKPVDAQQSIGVTLGITKIEQLKPAITQAIAHSNSGRALVQQQLHGKLYRLFILNGKMVAAALRRAPEVVGDGQHTIGQLIKILNDDPRRGAGMDTPLKQVKLSDAENLLGKDGLLSVPNEGETIKVSAFDSVSAGGQAINITDKVHQDWHNATTAIATHVGLFVCGYDVICEDISQPIQDSYLPLLEINNAPGLKLHQYPTGGGEPIDIAAMLLDEVFGIAKNEQSGIIIPS